MTPEDRKEITEIVRTVFMEVSRGNTPRPLLTPDDIASTLRIDKQTVYVMFKNNEIPYKRIGKFIRVEQKDFDRYLQKCAA